jgi:hypothetical protein
MDPLAQVDRPVPEFELYDLRQQGRSVMDARGKVLILVFWSAECPWSERADELIRIWRESWGSDVLVWMIASNLNEDRQLIEQVAEDRSIEDVLLDEDLRVADLFGAKTTPECYVIDGEGILRYQGAIDDTTFRQREATRYFLQEAVHAVLEATSPDPAETPGYGCTIVRIQPGMDSTTEIGE